MSVRPWKSSRSATPGPRLPPSSARATGEPARTPGRRHRPLAGHRTELVAERTRGINRLRVLLTRIFPGLERCFDYSTLTGLAFVTKFVTPSSITAASDKEIYDHLRGHGVRRPTIPKMIGAARTAAVAQRIALAGEATTAALVQQAASSLILLNVSVYWQDLIKGFILLAAVSLDHFLHKRKAH